MAEVTPPLYMDVSNVYSGDELGLPWRDVLGEGIVGAADLAVTAGTGNSVDIAAGAAWILGDTNPARQPNYRAINDAVVNRGVTPDPSNPRRVLVVAQVTDEGFAGTGRKWDLLAIHGTPAGSPVLPATPASALALANILVPAAAASSAAYTITDLRARAKVGAGGADAVQGAVELYDSGFIGSPQATLDSGTFVIPAGIEDIEVIVTGRGTDTLVRGCAMQLNGDTGANYDWRYDGGGASAAQAAAGVAATHAQIGVIGSASGAAGMSSCCAVLIPQGAIARTLHAAWRGGGGCQENAWDVSAAGGWRNTAAITRVVVFPSAGNWAAGSRLVVKGR